jgi:hypothetical protein
MNTLPFALIIGQVLGLKELEDPAFKENLEIVRKTTLPILNTTNNVSMELMGMHAQGHSIKKITTKNIL